MDNMYNTRSKKSRATSTKSIIACKNICQSKIDAKHLAKIFTGNHLASYSLFDLLPRDVINEIMALASTDIGNFFNISLVCLFFNEVLFSSKVFERIAIRTVKRALDVYKICQNMCARFESYSNDPTMTREPRFYRKTISYTFRVNSKPEIQVMKHGKIWSVGTFTSRNEETGICFKYFNDYAYFGDMTNGKRNGAGVSITRRTSIKKKKEVLEIGFFRSNKINGVCLKKDKRKKEFSFGRYDSGQRYGLHFLWGENCGCSYAALKFF